MKALDFQEYTVSVPDKDGDEHDSTIRAAVITADDVYLEDENGNRSRRELMTITGARQVSEGDVFVEGERAGEYDYLSASAWAATGYAGDPGVGEEQDTRTPAKKAVAKRARPSDNGS
jgi:hypothetical protein